MTGTLHEDLCTFMIITVLYMKTYVHLLYFVQLFSE